jgi:hypothetical protein
MLLTVAWAKHPSDIFFLPSHLNYSSRSFVHGSSPELRSLIRRRAPFTRLTQVVEVSALKRHTLKVRTSVIGKDGFVIN